MKSKPDCPGSSSVLCCPSLAKCFWYLFLKSSHKLLLCICRNEIQPSACPGGTPASVPACRTVLQRGICRGAVCPSLMRCDGVAVKHSRKDSILYSSKYLSNSLLLICTAFPEFSFPSLFMAGKSSAYCSS